MNPCGACHDLPTAIRVVQFPGEIVGSRLIPTTAFPELVSGQRAQASLEVSSADHGGREYHA